MNRDLKLWQLLGFGAVSLGGTLLHFLYDVTNESILVSPISGVNESTWEHMKLMFFPMFLFALIQHGFFKEYDNFWCVKLYGLLTALTLIPVLFYTYNGMFGKSPDWVNIAIFFISAAIAFITELKLFAKNTSCKYDKLALAAICVIGVLFVIFTFAPPSLPLFKDPIDGTYGLKK